jgi:hypothetical protein
MRLLPTLALASTLCAFLAGQAAAQTCAPPSVQASFEAAEASDADFVLALGRLSLFPGVRLPQPPAEGEAPVPYALRGVIEGDLASLDGFDDPGAFQVMVEVRCDGASCGAVPPLGEERLFFVERRQVGDETGNFVVQDPCPLWSLAATPEVVEGALACLRGEGCEAAE